MGHVHITFRYEDLSKDALLAVVKAYDARNILADKCIDLAYELALEIDEKQLDEELEPQFTAFLKAHEALIELQESHETVNSEFVNDR